LQQEWNDHWSSNWNLNFQFQSVIPLFCYLETIVSQV
jgi:hypothetical protein